jgi:hypothetical protein
MCASAETDVLAVDIMEGGFSGRQALPLQTQGIGRGIGGFALQLSHLQID